MSKISEKEWIEDFQDFVESKGVPVPESISQNILKQVRDDLSPSAWLVFGKLLGIHSVVGTLSLAICNQFGMSPFQTNFSLSDYFMKLGHSTCMFLCGVLFIGLSILIGRTVFRMEEFLVLRRNAPLQIFGLSAISLGVFVAVGAEIAVVIGFLWFLGAMVGGVSLSHYLHGTGHRLLKS